MNRALTSFCFWMSWLLFIAATTCTLFSPALLIKYSPLSVAGVVCGLWMTFALCSWRGRTKWPSIQLRLNGQDW